jgi:hypothetical protein
MIWIMVGAIPLLLFVGAILIDLPAAFFWTIGITAIAIGAAAAIAHGLFEIGALG